MTIWMSSKNNSLISGALSWYEIDDNVIFRKYLKERSCQAISVIRSIDRVVTLVTTQQAKPRPLHLYWPRLFNQLQICCVNVQILTSSALSHFSSLLLPLFPLHSLQPLLSFCTSLWADWEKVSHQNLQANRSSFSLSFQFWNSSSLFF